MRSKNIKQGFLKYIYTCDSMFHASIIHGSSLFHGSEARKSLACMHRTRKINLFRTLFMGFSSIFIIHVHPYVMGFLTNYNRKFK